MSSSNQNIPKIVVNSTSRKERNSATVKTANTAPPSSSSTTLQQTDMYSTLHVVIHIIIGFISYFTVLAYIWSTRAEPFQVFDFPLSNSSSETSSSSSSSETINRLSYTLRLQVYPVEVLQFLILAVIYCRLRHFIARNPLAGNEHLVEKANRILGNTVEQMFYFELALFIFAVTVSRKYLFLVPFSTAVFVVGRVVFAAGYYFHPKYRVVGFVWTMLPVFLLQAVNFFAFHGVDVLQQIDQWW